VYRWPIIPARSPSLWPNGCDRRDKPQSFRPAPRFRWCANGLPYPSPPPGAKVERGGERGRKERAAVWYNLPIPDCSASNSRSRPCPCPTIDGTVQPSASSPGGSTFSRPDLLPLVGSAEHRALARQAVAASLVLLKNEGGLLPLSPDIRHLYVAGAAADDIGIQSSGWTIEWQGKKGNITPGTTILEGIRQTVGPNTVVEHSRSGDSQGDVTAADAVCLAVVGELPYAEGKGDSETLNLPPGENRVLRRLEETCARLVVVLVSGRPLLVADHLARWDALVAAWLPGSEGARVADGLFGKVPFRGKTPFTWPASVAQHRAAYRRWRAGHLRGGCACALCRGRARRPGAPSGTLFLSLCPQTAGIPNPQSLAERRPTGLLRVPMGRLQVNRRRSRCQERTTMPTMTSTPPPLSSRLKMSRTG